MSKKIKKVKDKKPEKKVFHKNARYADRLEIIAYLPMIIAFGYIPLIVRGYEYVVPPVIANQPWSNSGTIIDFFLVYKSYAIIAMGICSIVMVLASLPQKPFRLDRIFIPLCVYAGMALLSAIISPWRYIAFAGSLEMFESVLVIVLGYIPICVATYHFVSYDGMAGIKAMLYGALPGVFILLILSFFQFLKLDIFRTEFGKHLMASQDLLSRVGDINFTFPLGTIYSTLYNTNFVGFYTAIFIALFFGLIFGASKIWEKVICVIGLALSLVCMYGSQTTTAWLVLAFMLAVGVLVWAFRNKKRGFVVLGCEVLVGIIGIVAIASNSSIGIKSRQVLGIGEENSYEFIVQGIDTNESGVDFTLNHGGLHIEYTPTDDGVNLVCKDGNGKDLKATLIDEDEHMYEIEPSDSFDGCEVQVNYTSNDNPYITVFIGKSYYGSPAEWRFVKYDDEDTYLYVNANGQTEVFPDTPKYANVFPHFLMSGRGGIWNFTLPLLPKHIILGSGANTYIMEYPQKDYIYEQISGGGHALDVKPHCFYFQQWVENGLIALIALMVFFGWYIYRSLKLYYSTSLKDKRIWISFGCFLGACGWLFAGIANDSNVCTTLPFWCILAVGFAINEFMIEERKDK